MDPWNAPENVSSRVLDEFAESPSTELSASMVIAGAGRKGDERGGCVTAGRPAARRPLDSRASAP